MGYVVGATPAVCLSGDIQERRLGGSLNAHLLVPSLVFLLFIVGTTLRIASFAHLTFPPCSFTR